MENKVKITLVLFAVSGLIIWMTACEIRNEKRGSESEREMAHESCLCVMNMLDDTKRIVLQKAETLLENVENLPDRLIKMDMDLPNEREKIQVIYPSDWCDDPYAEKYFPKGVIVEIADAFQENSLMEFIDSHVAEYQILSREEIEKYAISNDIVYNFIEEMEWKNSHMVLSDGFSNRKREEKIKETSETDAIWYALSLDVPDNIVVYGKYETYKFDLRGYYFGLALSPIIDELYFISWDEDNLVIEAYENLEGIRVIFFDSDIGYVAEMEKNISSEPMINYYELYY